jgi:16S rRNA (guanine1516-N2)-methyltransferase
MTIPGTMIGVAANADAGVANADRLAGELALPRCTPTDSGYSHVLTYKTDAGQMCLELRATHKGAPGPLRVDFTKGALAFRSLHGTRNNEPLARAVGLKSPVFPSVLDATAGLGRDAFILATLGCRVDMAERSPIIAALLRDGLARALASDNARAVAGRMRLHVGDAADIMAGFAEHERPDVVYLDPMYPHRGKSALVKKEMRLLRALVGEDPDTPQLLEAALTAARKRVVVKRPRLAAALPGIAPSHSLTGNTTRFDIYVRTHRDSDDG